MESINEVVGAVMEHMGGTVTSRAIAGEPLVIGDVTLVVLSTLSIGMGAGGGEGGGRPMTTKSKTGPGEGSGEGAGGGVKVRPAAVVAFTADGVKVLPIPGQPGVFDKMVERVPSVVEMVERARKAVEHPAV